MASQERQAAIVGIHEYPLRVAPDVTAMQIKIESVRRALADAGLSWQDVDAVYDTDDGEGGGGLGMASLMGVHPTVIDTTQVGGSSFEFQTAHALRAIAAGKCKVAIPHLRLDGPLGAARHRHRRRDRRGPAELAEQHGGLLRHDAESRTTRW